MSAYLAIDGWDEFQKYRGRRASFILDATDQWEKPKLSGLSHFVRSVLQELRRARGRTGKNIPYDMDHIAQATHTIGTDRPHLRHAILTLISRGVLVVTNQQDDVLNLGEIEKDNKIEIKKEQNHSARSASQETEPEQPKPANKPKPESVFDKAYTCYPRHIGKRAAEKAWGSAVNRESAKSVKSLAEHEDAIYQQVMHYAACCERFHKAREFIPHMATWLNQDRFLDDPSEWEVTRQEQRNGNGQVSKAEQRERERDRKWAAIAGGETSLGFPESSGIGLRPGSEPGTNRLVAKSAENEAKILAPGDN